MNEFCINLLQLAFYVSTLNLLIYISLTYYFNNTASTLYTPHILVYIFYNDIFIHHIYFNTLIHQRWNKTEYNCRNRVSTKIVYNLCNVNKYNRVNSFFTYCFSTNFRHRPDDITPYCVHGEVEFVLNGSQSFLFKFPSGYTECCCAVIVQSFTLYILIITCQGAQHLAPGDSPIFYIILSFFKPIDGHQLK